MSQVINTNVSSLNAQRNLSSSFGSLSNSLQRLSSGLRINSAKDDAAGLAVSERMTAQIRSLNQAARNANDGISMIQTAESGMSNIQGMLQRMKELATQAANDSISGNERKLINDELVQLRDEIDDTAGRLTFNGNKLLNGSMGAQLAATTEINAGTVVVAGTNTSVSAVNVTGARADTYTVTGDGTAGTVTLTGASGAVQTVNVSAVGADSTAVLNFDQLGIKISISSVAGETAANIATALNTANEDIIVTGSSASFQVGAGTTVGTDTVSVSFADIRLAGSGTAATNLTTALNAFNGAAATSSGTAAMGRDIMASVDGMIDFVSSERAKLGAVQNRFESVISSTQTASENIAASQSRIRDADFALETANLSRAQILQQAGTAMLAQANALPQNVLSLLRG